MRVIVTAIPPGIAPAVALEKKTAAASNLPESRTAVVGVGGFLGAGKKEVAVPFKYLKVVTRDNKDWLVLDQTKEELKAAPAYDKQNP